MPDHESSDEEEIYQWQVTDEWVQKEYIQQPMTLRNGKILEEHVTAEAGLTGQTESRVHALGQMCPMVIKGGIRSYLPWSFMDMVGLAGRLPTLTDGANKWISALEQSMAGVRLALRDMKAFVTTETVKR